MFSQRGCWAEPKGTLWRGGVEDYRDLPYCKYCVIYACFMSCPCSVTTNKALKINLNSVWPSCSWWWRQNTKQSGPWYKNRCYKLVYMLPLAGEASSAILLFSFWLVQSFVMSSRWPSKSTSSEWSPESSIWPAIARVSSHCRSMILNTARKHKNREVGADVEERLKTCWLWFSVGQYLKRFCIFSLSLSLFKSCLYPAVTFSYSPQRASMKFCINIVSLQVLQGH